jgi:hypothetical protein
MTGVVAFFTRRGRNVNKGLIQQVQEFLYMRMIEILKPKYIIRLTFYDTIVSTCPSVAGWFILLPSQCVEYKNLNRQ